ncbi:winged helix-turn-helix domain-containing protein [Devosia sp. ZB163]|uniref:winged helix-turn-helix domain-containing protein n=1 Tax=Devosia sp. ZB163 TaxID=3025938 RepID=UPI00235EE423|nr:winged helix-turn-helix domain-containing protein [Devosia sp. ZB163]MDC9824368.1 winged helix-turn-helix domain-containing protein [Devosia sp. ZB163]
MARLSYAFGPFTLDPAAGVLQREGEILAVGQRATALLRILIEAEGQPVTKDRLLAEAWPGLFVEEANLSVQVASLRKALGKAPDGDEWIATVPRVGYRLAHPGPASPPATQIRPAIAVLPFESLSADAADTYFADGVVEGITSALSRFRGFAVVARHAARALSPTDLPRARDELGVRYVLAGSVRRQGQRVRVSARLVDTSSMAQLWSTHLDGSLEDLFAFEDRITEEVVGLVEPEIRKAEIERARSKRPGSLDAYDLYLRALPLFRGTTPETRREAIRLLEDAVALDPGFSTAIAYLAWAYERQDTFGSGMTAAERARALELAERAIEHDSDDALVLSIAALVLLNVGGQPERSLAMFRRAFDANPNNATVIALTAFANVMVGDLAFGRECFLRGLRVAPGSLENYETLVGVGLSHILAGEFEPAADWALRSLASNPDWLGAYWTLAAAYGHLGRSDEARAVIAQLLQRAPHMRLADIERRGERYAERYSILVEGLRKAGLPA